MWERCLDDDHVVSRYRSMLEPAAGHVWWTGAVMRSGHGRFWMGCVDGHDLVVSAHRFAYGLAHGAVALGQAPVVMHLCDEPLCQDPAHLVGGTTEENRRDWLVRRNDLGSPFRDARGRHGRAMAIRDALLHGGDVSAVFEHGVPDRDWECPTLPTLESVSRYVVAPRHCGGDAPHPYGPGV